MTSPPRGFFGDEEDYCFGRVVGNGLCRVREEAHLRVYIVVKVMNLALGFVIHGWKSTGRIMLSITQEPSLLRKLNTIEV